MPRFVAVAFAALSAVALVALASHTGASVAARWSAAAGTHSQALRGHEAACGEGLAEAISTATEPGEGGPRLLCMIITPKPGERRNTVALETWMSRCDERAFLVARDPEASDPLPETFTTGETHIEPANTMHPSNKTYSMASVYPGVTARVIAINVTGTGRDCKGNNPECWKEGFLWRKVWQLYLKVYDEYIAKALAPGGGGWDSVPEWFVKADDDSYVFVSHLKRLIVERGYSADDDHYLGHALTHNLKRMGHDPQNGFISGTMIAFSRGAFRKLAERALASIPQRTAEFSEARGNRQWNCVDRLGPQEDWSTGFCMELAGVLATDLVDSQGRPHCLTWEWHEHLLHRWGADPTFNQNTEKFGMKNGGMLWYWHDKPQQNVMVNCCPPLDEIVSFHGFKSEEESTRRYEMRAFEDAMWDAKRKALAPLERACSESARALGVAVAQ